jgi:hypothetical protein
MSNHKARTWDHRESKLLGSKLLPLDHHLDGWELCSLVVGKVDGCIYMCSWEVELISLSSWNIFCRLQRSIQIWDMVSDKENLEIWSIQFPYTFYSSCLTDVVDSVRLWALACWQNVFAMSHKQVNPFLSLSSLFYFNKHDPRWKWTLHDKNKFHRGFSMTYHYHLGGLGYEDPFFMV